MGVMVLPCYACMGEGQCCPTRRVRVYAWSGWNGLLWQSCPLRGVLVAVVVSWRCPTRRVRVSGGTHGRSAVCVEAVSLRGV